MENNKITDEELDEIVEAAKENTPEEVVKMRESIANADSIREESGEKDYVEEIRNISLDTPMSELIGGETEDGLPVADVDILDIPDGQKIQIDDDTMAERVKDNAAMFNLSDGELIEFINLINRYRKGDKSNVYKDMPKAVKMVIAEMAAEEGVGIENFNSIAKMFLDEFISQAELDEAFIDIEKGLDEALKMPTIADMYSVHTNEIMNVKIPEIAEKIKDEEPENAKTLLAIKDRFNLSYSQSLLKEHYESNGRTRKLMRRDCADPFKYCDEYNFRNDKSKFKMPDCNAICPALEKVFISEVDPGSRAEALKATKEDLNKFIILFCRTSMNMNPNELLDASYMYYALKNITMLNLTNESKTPFAAELISNICDIIEFIRAKEAEFNDVPTNHKKHKRNNKHK